MILCIRVVSEDGEQRLFLPTVTQVLSWQPTFQRLARAISTDAIRVLTFEYDLGPRDVRTGLFISFLSTECFFILIVTFELCVCWTLIWKSPVKNYNKLYSFSLGTFNIDCHIRTLFIMTTGTLIWKSPVKNYISYVVFIVFHWGLSNWSHMDLWLLLLTGYILLTLQQAFVRPLVVIRFRSLPAFVFEAAWIQPLCVACSAHVQNQQLVLFIDVCECVYVSTIMTKTACPMAVIGIWEESMTRTRLPLGMA